MRANLVKEICVKVPKLLKMLFAGALFFALLLACSVPGVGAAEATAPTQAFPDVQSSDYFFDAVESLTAEGILSGYEDGMFRPNQPVTREQVAKIISLALGLDIENLEDPGFSDVKDSDYFYAYIAALAGKGVLEGQADGSFVPKNNLTRAQMAKILSKAYDLGEEKLGDNVFTDVKDSDWFSTYLPALIANGITLGRTADTYDPNGTVTRAQIAAFVYRCGNIDRPLNGWVYAGAPVADAILSVYDTSGDRILETDALATDQQGAILGGTISKFPSDFRIVAEGGTLDGEESAAKLSADIRGFKPSGKTIFVNLTTTIVSAYLDTHSEAGLAEAEIAVKSFLEIPETVELASGTQLSNEYFNNAQFLREANENGGVNPFIETLLAEMGASGTTHPFQAPLPPQGGAGAWLATTLAEGAVSYVGGELMGWGLDKAGINFGEEDHTAEELAKIEEGMAEMKTDMARMSIQLEAISGQLRVIVDQLKVMLKELSHKLALDEYGTRVGQLNSLISSVDSIQSDLNHFVNNPPSNLEVQRQSLIDRIERNIIDQADVIHNQLVGMVGQKGLLTLWREIVYENRFLDWEDYDRVKAQYDYFRQYQDSILLLQVEYYHAIEGAPGDNTAVIMNCIDRYKEHIEQQDALMVLPIEKYCVIDARHNIMYYSENIEFGQSDSAFTIAGKTSAQVKAYMFEFAGSGYAGFGDWKPMDNKAVPPLLDGKNYEVDWFLSDLLIKQGWPGSSVKSGTVVPWVSSDSQDLHVLMSTSTEFLKSWEYPDSGFNKEPGFAMITAYRRVTADAYGYGHVNVN